MFATITVPWFQASTISLCGRAAEDFPVGLELSLLSATSARDGLHHLRQHGLSRRAAPSLLTGESPVSGLPPLSRNMDWPLLPLVLFSLWKVP